MSIKTNQGDRLWGAFRKAMWGGALFLLLLPAAAMQFTSEVRWDAFDFIFAAVLLFGSAGLIEIAVRASSSSPYRAGVVIAVAAGFLTIWANGAVGMIGSEDNLYNLWFIGVVVLALAGAIATMARPNGMAVVMTAAAIAQAVAAAIGLSADPRGGLFSLIFALPWLLSAAFFRAASGGEAKAQ